MLAKARAAARHCLHHSHCMRRTRSSEQMPGILELLSQTWPARLAQDAWSAATLPRDVYQGRVDPLSAEQYGRLVESALKRDPALASSMVEAVARGKGVDWFIGFAKARPDFTVAKSGSLVRPMVEQSSDPIGIFKDAGFDALDSGRDVRKLGAEGGVLRATSIAAMDCSKRSRSMKADARSKSTRVPLAART